MIRIRLKISNFLLGEDFDSFEQWKDMFLLCTNVDKYIFEQGNIQYAIDLVPVLYGMLKQFPRDFFIDNISKDNFIKKSLMEFIQVCTEENENKKLINRAKKLQEMLEHKFLFFPSNKIIEKNDGKYQYEMDDEDKPNIVDLNQQFISF
ncbi:hypothetical protein PPERSA_11185 [Pseudocohnilembus persalinus]|uniref:AAR2 C-terminal domain-containing protein n=1 Tax=Pseudocohnilembus persalinus TaxID=266149 RepID=A0A0V0QZF7_PSEPJ|nr:hypothetical protein PPERSA_11185 [Pseudocohnilembus persalinus]|eukprot:KRX07636.1 hypothetical protein PPERSA_11185 [Pseudocohnilembus persalinus]